MVIAQIRVNWLSEQDFGKIWKVNKVYEVKGLYGQELEVEFCNERGEYRKSSCYGLNLETMIKICGADTDGWVGRTVIVNPEVRNVKGKDKRIHVWTVNF